MKKRKSDIINVLFNTLCLVSLIFDIELKYYFSMSHQAYIYPTIMANLAGPLIVCLLIIFRQSRHQKSALLTNILIDSCSAGIFLAYILFVRRFRLTTVVSPEYLVLLCLFIVPAIYNIYKKFTAKSPSYSGINRA